MNEAQQYQEVPWLNSNNINPQQQQQQQPEQSAYLSPEQANFLMDQQQQQEQLFFLQQDLQAAFQREQALLQELHNLTANAAGLQRREELHLHQLDVLTERVMDVEAAGARDRNVSLELQANCTALALQLAEHESELQEWQQKCNELVELRSQDEAKIRELKKKYKAAARESEELAEMIERHRLRDEGTEFHHTKKKKKRRGFFAWLFGFGSVSDHDGFGNDEAYEEMQEAARSTLLAALRTERNSVSELETAVATLQQNNSAIAEQVQSRDQIIDELNNRVAVFEEDKLVLKAALRQLQKEMNEEAPKTQKLVSDLAAAKKEVKRLKLEMEKLEKAHKKEAAALQKVIRQKEEKAKVIESNMTVIGAYVDKLEERLADFTVQRKGIEKREKACKNLEQKAANATSEKEILTTRITELDAEHVELKKLLDELAKERANLQKEAEAMTSDRELLKKEAQNLRQAYAKLENETKALEKSSEQWRLRSQQVESKLNATETVKERLVQQLELSESEKAQLRKQVQGVSSSQQEHISMLEQAAEAKLALERRVAELESERQSSSQTSEAVVEEMKRSLEDQRKQLEMARQEQQRAIAEAKKATETASEAESKRLEAEAAASKAADEIATMKAAEEAAKKAAAEAAQRQAARQTATKVSSARKSTDASSGVEQQEQGVEKEPTKSIKPSGGKRLDDNKEHPSDIPPETGKDVSDQRIEDSSNYTNFPFDPSVRPIPYVKPDMRPKDAEKAPLQPPYLPKTASSPKRQFGSGLVKESPQPSTERKSGTIPASNNSTKTDKPRKVRLRKVRKAFSKRTGVHGLFTPPSNPSPKRTKKETTSTAAAAVATPSTSKKKVPLRKVRKFFAKTTGVHGLFSTPSNPHPKRQKKPGKTKDAKPAGSVPSSGIPSKPNEIKHTFGGLQYSPPPKVPSPSKESRGKR